MQNYRIYTPDFQFPDGWMHLVSVCAADWQQAIALARRFSGLNDSVLKAVAV